MKNKLNLLTSILAISLAMPVIHIDDLSWLGIALLFFGIINFWMWSKEQ